MSQEVLVVYITPDEEAKSVLLTGFPEGDPRDYMSQIEGFIQERICFLPYLMIPLPQRIDVFSSEGKGTLIAQQVISLG